MSKPILTAAMVIRNEEEFIEASIREILSWADQIVILDDASDDKTPEILEDLKEKYKDKAPIHVHRPFDESIFFDAENELREMLWCELLPKYDHDWVIAIDTDETIDPYFRTVRDRMMAQDVVNCYSFQFWEFWGDTEHVRVDRMWNPGLKQMGIMVRWQPQINYQMSPHHVHGARIPLNVPEPIIPSGLYIKHYGWSIPENEQRRKYKYYRERDPQPHPQMQQHYESIVYGEKQLIRWYLD